MRVADLFAGCGGMSLGLTQAGMQVAFAAETWAEARLTYETNLGHWSTPLDLSNTVEAASVVARLDVDLVAGGPPCQDFSVAGTRVEGERADLTWTFAEVVRACRPTWFLMENVPAATSSRSWAIAAGRLRGAGYGLTEEVLDASLYGVPQSRRRAFMVGRLREPDGFLSARLTGLASSRPTTVRDCLGNGLGVEHFYSHPRNPGRRAVHSLDEPAPTVRATNRPVPPGYRPHPRDSACARTVDRLTARQRARIQGFPSDFRFDPLRLCETQVDGMVANAVPPPLARAVGWAILAHEAALATRAA